MVVVTEPTPPDDMVITVDELKLNCGFSTFDTDFDSLFRSLVLEATQYVEDAARQFLRPVVVEESFERFPGGNKHIRLSRGPVRSVVSLTHVDSNGVTQTLVQGIDYGTWLNYNPPMITRIGMTRWPVVKAGYTPALTVTYNAGPATVTTKPNFGMIAAIKMIATATYQNQDGRERRGPLIIPPAAMSMIHATAPRGY